MVHELIPKTWRGWLIVVLILLNYAILSRDYIGKIEGRVFPVVTPAKLSHPRFAGPPEFRHKWRATSFKLRNCVPVGDRPVTWFLGQPGGAAVETPTYFEDAPQVRPTGALAWSGLVVDLDRDRLKTNSYAVVHHQCRWRFWVTESIFYISEG